MAGTRVEAERLRLELARRGWDGCDLATAAGLSTATVSATIRGRPVSTATLRKMVVALSRHPCYPESTSYSATEAPSRMTSFERAYGSSRGLAADYVS